MPGWIALGATGAPVRDDGLSGRHPRVLRAELLHREVPDREERSADLPRVRSRRFRIWLGCLGEEALRLRGPFNNGGSLAGSIEAHSLIGCEKVAGTLRMPSAPATAHGVCLLLYPL